MRKKNYGGVLAKMLDGDQLFGGEGNTTPVKLCATRELISPVLLLVFVRL